jgi:RNA ligase
MNYKFPIIERIEDVLPAIAGRDEFIVAEREGYTVINYNVGFADTFTIDENDVMENHGRMIPKGVMRRECRGLIFGPDGRIMSRSVHKFFNVNEREETQIHMLDMSKPHEILEKMDGSMIRPIMVDGEVRLATKMGVTDTALVAERWLHGQEKFRRAEMLGILETAIFDGVTPIFEFIAPNNRIVLEYAQADLVLLALRDNRTGYYFSLDSQVGQEFCDLFTRVPAYGSVDGSFAEYIERARARVGREGDVIRFADGHMVKIKNDWYVQIHKTKDQIRNDRNILALLLNNALDDVMGFLDINDRARVLDYERRYHEAYRGRLAELEAIARRVLAEAGGDRKTLATVVLPQSGLAREEWAFMFNAANGRDMNEMLQAYVMSKLGSTARYNEMAAFIGLSTQAEEELAVDE